MASAKSRRGRSRSPGRKSWARGVQAWASPRRDGRTLLGTGESYAARVLPSLRDLKRKVGWAFNPGLTSWATFCRPSGTRGGFNGSFFPARALEVSFDATDRNRGYAAASGSRRFGTGPVAAAYRRHYGRKRPLGATARFAAHRGASPRRAKRAAPPSKNVADWESVNSRCIASASKIGNARRPRSSS